MKIGAGVLDYRHINETTALIRCGDANQALTFLTPRWPISDKVFAFCTLSASQASLDDVEARLFDSQYQNQLPSPVFHAAKQAGHQKTAAKGRVMIKSALKPFASRFIYPHQVHGNDIAIVDKHYLAKLSRYAKRPPVDAVMTQLDKICCGVFTADCVPILIASVSKSGHPTVAAIHAGRAGLLNGLIAKTVKKCATNASEIWAWIGPSISAEHYILPNELREDFLAQGVSSCDVIKHHSEGHFTADLEKFAINQLKALGVSPEQILSTNICTYRTPSICFSYRYHQHRNIPLIYDGRHYTGIVIQDREDA